MENKKERRSVPSELAEVRLNENPVDGEARKVSGYGIVFNSLSNDLGGWREIILPDAADGILEQSDVLALMEHDRSRGVLARSDKGLGSMKLTIDETGVRYEFEAPKFDLGNELIEGIERGDIKASSFAFTVEKSGQEVVRQKDGSYLRTIKKFKRIHDMSPVINEAYSDTNVFVRSLEDIEKDATPIIEEPIIEKPADIPEYKMDNEERLLYQKHKQYKLK